MSVFNCGGQGAGGADFDIEFSALFVPAQNNYLKRNTVLGDRLKWTLSVWVYNTTLDSGATVLSAHQDSNNKTELSITGANEIKLNSESSGTTIIRLDTTDVPVSVTTWQHYHFVFDAGNATQADRWILKVDGVASSLSTTAAIALNEDTKISKGIDHYIGSRLAGLLELDGYLADYHFIDSAVVDVSEFGKSSGGSWVPVEYLGSHGTTGYHLDFSSSGNMGNDASNTSADWTNFGTSQSTFTPTS